MQSLLDNPILTSITLLFDKKKLLFKNPQVLLELESSLACVSDFFEVDQKTSAVIGVLICGQIIGEPGSINKTMRLMGLDAFDSIYASECMREFRKRGWIKFVSNKYMNSPENCEIASDVIGAVMQNDKSKLQISVPENLTDALFTIRKIITDTRRSVPEEEVVESILSAVERFNRFSYLENILVNKDLSPAEKYVLIWMSTEVLINKEELDLNEVIEMFTDGCTELYYLLMSIRTGKSALMRDGYLKFVHPNLADFSAVTLNEDLLKEIQSSCTFFADKKFTSRYCQIIKPEEIQEQSLFFNPGNKLAIDTIFKFTSNEKFIDLETKFTMAGMKPGLTMMFYGLPGTGKTELVKQIAKLHNRTILQVDIASIKNMWVGESEKNMKKVFKDYKEAIKQFDQTPILLFNEADAILGERRQVNNSVDQMLNSMQNILLQELEDFNGIFIATTNLISNIDGAFDRRMLYKLNFESPNNETRYRILESQFPELPSSLLHDISTGNSLSGGQIQNIKKKYLVDKILSDEEGDCTTRILNYVEEETQFRMNSKNKIGFSLN